MDDKRDSSLIKQRGDFYAIPVRQFDVHDDYVGRISFNPFQRSGAGREDAVDLEPRIAQQVFQV